MINVITVDNYVVSLQRAITIKSAYNGSSNDTDLINNLIEIADVETEGKVSQSRELN